MPFDGGRDVGMPDEEGVTNFDNLADLESKIESFIAEWNECAHPFRWTKASFAKIIAKVEDSLARAA